MNLPRAAERWLTEFLADRTHRVLHPPPRARRLHVAITDHFEPIARIATHQHALARVAAWQRRWPEIALAAPRDAAGQTPQYAFFYPEEEYDPEILTAIATLCHAGFGAVEVHLHHDHETAGNFRSRISTFVRRLHQDHGLLQTRAGEIVFGFIHGNWALDNSRPDGRWCGLTGEVQILRELGCYADFTMPSAPSETQGGPVNRIFWSPSLAPGEPPRPGAYRRGIPATPGAGRQGELLLIPGPLGLRRGLNPGLRSLVPRLEMGELALHDPPTPERVPLWVALAPQLGEDLFLKLYSHGAREDNAGALIGSDKLPGLLPTLTALSGYAQEHQLELHWATPYQMFQAAERLLSPATPLLPDPRHPGIAAGSLTAVSSKPSMLAAAEHQPAGTSARTALTPEPLSR